MKCPMFETTYEPYECQKLQTEIERQAKEIERLKAELEDEHRADTQIQEQVKKMDDEIERLTKELDLIRADAKNFKSCWDAACHDIDRLQGLLREIAEHEHCDFGGKCQFENDPHPAPRRDSVEAGWYMEGIKLGHRCAAAIARKGSE